jgi:dTMP kinase
VGVILSEFSARLANGGGIHYAWEGPDGAGKTTQIDRFRQLLETRRPGKVAPAVDLPSHTRPIGKFIREEILSGKIHVDSDITQNLMVLDIAETYRAVIRPALQAGNDVVVSRGFGSNYAYSRALGIPKETILAWHALAQTQRPDLTFLLRVDAKISMDRIERRQEEKTLYEKEEMQRRVGEAFDEVVSQNPERWIVLNGNKTIDEITEEAQRAWKSYLARRDMLHVYGL